MEFNLHALMEELMTFEKELDDSKFYAKVVIFFVFCSFKSNALLTENQKDNLNLWLLAINCKLFSSWYYRAAYKTLSMEGGGITSFVGLNIFASILFYLVLKYICILTNSIRILLIQFNVFYFLYTHLFYSL